MAAKLYVATFSRSNFHYEPPLTEWVVVIVETAIPEEDYEEFDKVVWKALWKQYPMWKCPYHQGNPPPNEFEKLRHSFSSAMLYRIRAVDELII